MSKTGSSLITVSGLDLRSASIDAPKGSTCNMLNFEKDQGPGLVRRQGWCRYDGRIMGPEIENGVVCLFAPANLTGTFKYGEQVQISSAGYPTLQAIYIGMVISFAGANTALCFAYPVNPFSSWVDFTMYPTATTISGLSSAAFLSSLFASPTLMNDSTITIQSYDNLKRNIARFHYQNVLAVPGRNESPVDCQFTYNNNSYAIHDCVTFAFNLGRAPGNIYPLEGHLLKDSSTGNVLGKILNISVNSDSWSAITATGQIVVYDYPLGQAFPVIGSSVDLYSADGVTLLQNRSFSFNGNLNAIAPATNTRAILYSTYEQYVRTQQVFPPYGPAIPNPPIYLQPAPPTWARVRINREIPYTTVGTTGTSGLAPPGGNAYSIYEYSRLGLVQNLQALQPIANTEVFPTVATDYGGAPLLTPWVNPNNIKVQDLAVASFTSVATPGSATQFLGGSSFDFSGIPDGSTILGVQFRIRASASIAGAWIDVDVRMQSNSLPNNQGSQNKAGGFVPTAVLTDKTYGSATDTWGEQLNTSVLKDPSFGFRVKWKKVTGAATTINMDCYACIVTYVPQTRLVYIRDTTIVAAPSQDVLAQIIHYSIDSGTFDTQTAVGVLTALIGTTEAQGTAAGKIRRLKAGDEVRTVPSTAGTNAANGALLCLVTSEDIPISYPPSAALNAAKSKYEVIEANFWDVPEGRAAYTVNGVEFATMFDGTYVVRIRTGRPTISDNPRHVAQHGSPTPYLYLGFSSGSVINTGTGRPLSVLGAIDNSVKNFGEPVTGMMSLNGSTLGIWTDRSVRGLQGNFPGTQSPIMVSPAINCIEYSLVNLVGEAVWMSYRGVETVRTVNAYGDFQTLPLSAAAQIWLQGRIQVDLAIGSRPSRLVAAIGVRNKRQYRAFFEDGFVYTITLADAGDLPVSTIQQLLRPNSTTVPGTQGPPDFNTPPSNAGVIRHIYNGTRSDGKELILASFENQNDAVIPAIALPSQLGPYFPFTVRLDVGYVDDVQPFMPCFIEFNAIYAGFPTQSQKWQGGTIFVNCYGGSQLTTMTKLDYDGPIFDYLHIKNTLVPDDPQVQVRTWTLPIKESKAFIPIPQQYCIFDIEGQGRMLKLLIDAQQLPSSLNPSVVPLRITHIALTTESQDMDKP